MRFLEDAYASKGGSKHLYMLFDAVPDAVGVLVPIHELAGLPVLKLETDEGFRAVFQKTATPGSALGWRLGFYRNPK